MSDSRSLEIEHRYGPRVHLLSDPWMLATLARIGSPDVHAPEVIGLVRSAYRILLHHAAASEFPRTERAVDTRMKQHTEHGVWRGVTVDPQLDVAVANVLRAGNLPSVLCLEELGRVVGPGRVRIDHFYLGRVADEAGHVVGVESAGSKIGGPISDRIVLIPDPMGATGSTILEALAAYRARDLGRPAKVIALHLMITPEYLRRVLDATDDVIVYAGRLDRGLSPDEVLAKPPGEDWERERGLTENGYIVPGAGGLGEVLTNAWC